MKEKKKTLAKICWFLKLSWCFEAGVLWEQEMKRPQIFIAVYDSSFAYCYSSAPNSLIGMWNDFRNCFLKHYILCDLKCLQVLEDYLLF